MPRNGSGSYSFPATTWDPAVGGVTATVADWNTREADVSAALTASVAADGQTPMTGNLQMGGNRVTGLGAPVAASDAARFTDTTGRLIGMQSFIATGVYTPTTGTTSVIVEVQAPGGGSGGCVATTAGQWSAGGSGGGGGYGRKRLTAAFSGVTVTIGAPGTAGAAGNNSGGTGGTTSFGALCSCAGGQGGAGSGAVQTAAGFAGGVTAANAGGGAPSSVDVGRVGSSPQASFALSTSLVYRGNGGDAYWGSGGIGGILVSNNATSSIPGGYGGGAAGPAQCNGIFAAAAGVAGAPGIVVIWEFS